MNWGLGRKMPCQVLPILGKHPVPVEYYFQSGNQIQTLLCKILGYGTLQRPAVSCTRNKRTVKAAPHNTYSLLLAHSTSSLSVPRKPGHGLTSPLVLPAEEPGASPGHSCLLDAAGQLSPGTRQGRKCLGEAVLAFDSPILSTLQTSQSMQIVTALGFLLAEVQQGGTILGALLSIPFSAALTNLCLTKSTKMLHYQHQTQRRGLM